MKKTDDDIERIAAAQAQIANVPTLAELKYDNDPAVRFADLFAADHGYVMKLFRRTLQRVELAFEKAGAKSSWPLLEERRRGVLGVLVQAGVYHIDLARARRRDPWSALPTVIMLDAAIAAAKDS
jgi:hypothetical protein